MYAKTQSVTRLIYSLLTTPIRHPSPIFSGEILVNRVPNKQIPNPITCQYKPSSNCTSNSKNVPIKAINAITEAIFSKTDVKRKLERKP